MNFKCGNQILVEYIYSEENGYECLATINNYSSILERIVVGESMSSNEFAMIFPNSIGESKWKLLFYPKGQYVGEEIGKSVAIYLVLLSCEQEGKPLKANVAFQLKSQIDDSGPVGPVKNLIAEFDYSVPAKRWIGEPYFVGKNWLKKKKIFCINNSLVIRCLVEERILNSKEAEFDVVENKTNGSQASLKEQHEHNLQEDAQNKNDWILKEKKSAKKTKKQLKNQSNNADAARQSSSRQKERKNKSNKGGKKKK